jgi:hypothetical protein
MESIRISIQTKVVFFLLPLLVTSTAAFTTPLTHHAVSTMTPTTRRIRPALRPQKMASEDVNNDEASTTPSGKRRKRKDGNQFSPPTSLDSDNSAGPLLEAVAQSELNMPPLTPAAPKENVVVMKVRDIRDVVSGTPEPTLIDDGFDKSKKEHVDIVDEDDDELADDEEWEYFDVDNNGNEVIVSNERVERIGEKDDSIEQLLADARQMRRAKPADDGGNESSSTMKNTIFEVISTIVTVDFFVVIGLLGWFLAGIFCSSVLHNDAVQIAFNMNFERVTQPALGILMIGSVAGALGNKGEEE